MGSWMALPARYFLHDLVTGGTSHNGSRHSPMVYWPGGSQLYWWEVWIPGPPFLGVMTFPPIPPSLGSWTGIPLVFGNKVELLVGFKPGVGLTLANPMDAVLFWWKVETDLSLDTYFFFMVIGFVTVDFLHSCGSWVQWWEVVTPQPLTIRMVVSPAVTLPPGLGSRRPQAFGFKLEPDMCPDAGMVACPCHCSRNAAMRWPQGDLATVGTQVVLGVPHSLSKS